MDFVADGLINGRKLRCLNIVDDFELWRIEYNTERSHSSLDDLTPEQFANAAGKIWIKAGEPICKPRT